MADSSGDLACFHIFVIFLISILEESDVLHSCCFFLLPVFSLLFPEHGEGLQILHYEVGQKYEPHYDYFLDEFNTKNGGQRIATVLMYL